MEESSFLLLLLLARGLTPGPWGRNPTIRDRRTGTVHVLPFPASFSSKPIPLLPPPPSSPRERWARKVHRKREREGRARFGKLRRQKNFASHLRAAAATERGGREGRKRRSWWTHSGLIALGSNYNWGLEGPIRVKRNDWGNGISIGFRIVPSS